MTKVIEEIEAERERQKSKEGWTPEHDDKHDDEQLARAAACYTMPSYYTTRKDAMTPDGWPWSIVWWKPKERRYDLVRAAALIVAEIERLDRASSKMRR